MTSALPTPRHPTQALDALLRAHAQSSFGMAVYLIGGGALVATALLMQAYSARFSGTGQWLPLISCIVAALWVTAGGWLAHRHQQHLLACEAAYEADLQRIAQARRQTAKPARHSGWTLITQLIHQTTLAAQRGQRPPALPVSLLDVQSPEQLTLRQEQA